MSTASAALDGREPQPAESEDDTTAYLSSLLTSYPDWPAKGVLFRDIFPIFQSPTATARMFDLITNHISLTHGTIDAIVALDARGFLLGAPIAPRLSASFVPIRKAGKLPGPCLSIDYTKEYGPDLLQLQAAALRPSARVVVVDDLLATGGTLGGAVGLCRLAGAVVVECVVLIELCGLEGRARVGAPVHSFIKF